MELSKKINELLNEKNITFKEINEKLKIPKKFLNALEHGEISDFPPRVYVIGYLKEIANFIGTDEDEIIKLYSSNANEGEEPSIKYEPVLEIDKKHNLGIFITLFLFILIIVAVLYLFIKEKPANKTEAPVIQQKKSVKNLKDNLKNKTHTLASRKGYMPNDNNTGKRSVKKGKENIFEELKNKIDKETIFPKENAKTFKEKDIVLFALDKVWVRVTLDNKTVKTFIIKKGDTRKVNVKHTIKLDIGNAGNLKMFVNGYEYPRFGKNGEVVHKLVVLDNSSFKF
jgi:cytoskeletal protein RodZ